MLRSSRHRLEVSLAAPEPVGGPAQRRIARAPASARPSQASCWAVACAARGRRSTLRSRSWLRMPGSGAPRWSRAAPPAASCWRAGPPTTSAWAWRRDRAAPSAPCRRGLRDGGHAHAGERHPCQSRARLRLPGRQRARAARARRAREHGRGCSPAGRPAAAPSERALFGQPGIASVRPARAGVDALQDALESYSSTIGILAAITLAMALLVAFTSTSVSVDERGESTRPCSPSGCRPAPACA